MTRTQWLIEYVLGDCTCTKGYTIRGMTSPHCERCQDEDSLREALLLAYQLGHDSKDSNGVVAGNREALKPLLKELVSGSEEEGEG